MTTTVTTSYPARGQVICSWADLDAGDTGLAVDVGSWNEKTIQIPAAGTSTITVQGSNDGTNWATLNSKGMDADSAIPLSALGAGIYSILENPRYIRPVAAAGDTSNLAITLFGVKNDAS